MEKWLRNPELQIELLIFTDASVYMTAFFNSLNMDLFNLFIIQNSG